MAVLLGFVLGVIATTAFLCLLGSLAEQSSQATDKQTIHEIERQTIRQMVATALMAEPNGTRQVAPREKSGGGGR